MCIVHFATQSCILCSAEASEECLAAAGEEVQAAGEVQAGEEVQNGVGDDVRMQECSGEDAGGEEGSDAEQPDEHQPQAQQQTTTSVEWLARQTLAFQEKAGAQPAFDLFDHIWPKSPYLSPVCECPTWLA